MLEVTVKTLDGKNRSFCVPDDITVRQFKEKISNSIEIPAETQRLIYQGRVLQDEKRLDEYDVNGHTVHVVARPPPSVRNAPSTSTASSTSSSASSSRQGQRDGSSYVLGSFTLPADIMDPNHVQNIVTDALNGLGDMGRNARVQTRASNDGSSVDVHINLGQIGPPQLHSESQNRINSARRLLNFARNTLDRLENPSSSDSEDNAEMDTSSPRSDGASENTNSGTPGTGATPSTSTSSSTPSNTGASNSTEQDDQNSNQNSGQPRQPNHPPTSTLADVFDEVFQLNTRLQPHLERYQNIMRDDPDLQGNDGGVRENQRVCNLVSSVLHYISHAYHHISDLMVDLQRAPPRQLHAGPSMGPPPGMVPHAIPVQAQVHVATNIPGGGSPRIGRRAPSTPASSSSSMPQTASSTATNSTATSTPTSTTQTGAGGPPHGQFVNIASSNPMVFMEVRPQTFTINSISAHVVSANSPGSSSTAGSTQSSPSQTTPRAAGPFPSPGTGRMPHAATGPGGVNMVLPPGLIGSVLRMAAQQHTGAQRMPHTAGGSTTTTSASSTMPSPSPSPRPASTSQSSPTRSTSTQAGGPTPGGGPIPAGPHPQGAAFVIPGPPMGAMPPGFPVPLIDNLLPCNSRHFLAHQVVSSQQPQQPEEAMAGVVSSLISNLVSQHGQNLQGQAGSSSNTSGSSSNVANSRPATNTTQPQANAARPTSAPASSNLTAGTGRVNLQPQFETMLQQFMQNIPGQLRAQTPPTPGTQSSNQANQPRPQIPTAEMFAQLLGGAPTAPSGQNEPQRQGDTIADFLQRLGSGFEVSQDGGILTDLFCCLAQHWTLGDLATVIYGQRTPIQRIQAPLRDFVSTRVLRGQEPTEANIRQAVERLIEESKSDLESMCEDAAGREDIDLEATCIAYMRHHLYSFITFISNSPAPDPQFGNNLYARCERALHEYVALCLFALEGGQTAFYRLIRSRVQSISEGINPIMQQTMVTLMEQQGQRLVSSLNVSSDEIQQYVVRRSAMESSPKSSDSFMSAEENLVAEVSSTTDTAAGGSVSAMGIKNEAEAMDVDSSEAAHSSERSRSRTNPTIAGAILHRVPPPPSADPQDDQPVELGSESWHEVLPPEWVPVISRDVNRQRRQAPQAPFSDAYLSGMPAKRRKLVNEQKNDPDPCNLPSIIPEAIKVAAQAAGVEPVTSQQQVDQAAAEDEVLRETYHHQVQQAIRERTRTDPDYVPEKFPNTEKYIKHPKK